MRSDLSCRVKPSRWSGTGRYNDSAALELAHIFIVHMDAVHACAWHVFLCRKYFIKAQLWGGHPKLGVFDLKQSPRPVIVLELVREEVLNYLGNLSVLIIIVYDCIHKGASPSGGVRVYANQRLNTILNHTRSFEVSTIPTYQKWESKSLPREMMRSLPFTCSLSSSDSVLIVA